MKQTQVCDLWTQVIETTPHIPDLKWWGKMLLYLLILLVSCYGVFWVFSWSVIHFIDLENEEKYLWGIFFEDESKLLDMSTLTYSLPEEKSYDIYILEEESENAFAMVWARLMITRGLLESIAYEEELLFIIGHEIHHLENRDALRNFVLHAPLSLSLSLLGFDAGLPLDQILQIFVHANSRAVERKADQGWIELLHELELNSECAIGFFERNGAESEKYFELFSTHPLSKERIEFIRSSKGSFEDKECTPFTYS